MLLVKTLREKNEILTLYLKILSENVRKRNWTKPAVLFFFVCFLNMVTLVINHPDVSKTKH